MKQLSTGQIQAVLDAIERRPVSAASLDIAVTKLRDGLNRGRERDRRRGRVRTLTCPTHPDEPVPCIECQRTQKDLA